MSGVTPLNAAPIAVDVETNRYVYDNSTVGPTQVSLPILAEYPLRGKIIRLSAVLEI